MLYTTLLIIIFSVVHYSAQEASAGLDDYIFGVTITNPLYENEQEKNEIRDALASHVVKPTARFVFDECMYPVDKCVAACNECWDPSGYQEPLENIASAAFVMGEILDSAYVVNYSVAEYIERTNEYLNRFDGLVDIWEIGNEVNGDWLGETANVVDKIQGAYDAVTAKGGVTALNLYYNKSCLYGKPEHEMFTWAQAHIPIDMRNGLDYVFFSYYEDDCNGVVHTQEEWQAVFDNLHLLFPNAKLGFGEVGTKDADKKAEQMQRYYSLDIKGDYYVGGHFWWYYRQDCVPKTTELWSTLNSLFLQQKGSGWLASVLSLLL